MIVAHVQAAPVPDTAAYGWHEWYPVLDFGQPWRFYATPSGGYILCDGQVLRSRDLGKSWSRFELPACSSARAAAFSGDTLGFVAGDNGMMYKTTDGGSSWKLKQTLSSVNIRMVTIVTPTILYASGGYGLVLKSTDAGETWTTPDYIDLFTFSPHGAYAFVYPNSTTDVWMLRDSRILLILSSGAIVQGQIDIFHSTDGGNSWQKKGGPFVYENEPDDDRQATDFTADGSMSRSCGQNNFSFNVRMASSVWKNYSTSNDGVTWDSSAIPAGVPVRYQHMFDCQTGWASSYTGNIIYYTSPANNEQWLQHTAAASGTFFTYDFTDTLTGYALVLNSQTASVLRTTDGGGTWATAYTSPLNTGTSMRAVSFVSPLLGWTLAHDAQGDVLLGSSDGGLSWSAINRDARLHFASKLQFVNANSGWIFGDSVYSTADGGATLTAVAQLPYDPLRPQVHYVQVQFADAKIGWAVRSDLFTEYTSDGGAIWNPIHASDTTANVTIATLQNKSNLIAMGTVSNSPYAFRILENGKQFQPLPVTTDQNQPTLPTQLYFIDSLNGWFIDTIPNLYRTYDGGVTWYFLSSAPTSKPPLGMVYRDTTTGYLIKGNDEVNGTVVSGPAIVDLDQGGANPSVDQCLFHVMNAITMLGDTLGWAVGGNEVVYHFYLPKGYTPHPGPVMLLNKPLINFGTTKPGVPKIDSFDISNVGGDTLFIYGVGITNDPYHGFNLATIIAGAGLSLPPGYDIPIKMDFDPPYGANYNATMYIYSNTDTQHIYLQGVGGVVGVDEGNIVTANGFALRGYPNPFHASTSLTTESASGIPEDATVKIYDALGREVADLTKEFRSASAVLFQGANLPAGYYVARLQSPTISATQVLMLVK